MLKIKDRIKRKLRLLTVRKKISKGKTQNGGLDKESTLKYWKEKANQTRGLKRDDNSPFSYAEETQERLIRVNYMIEKNII